MVHLLRKVLLASSPRSLLLPAYVNMCSCRSDERNTCCCVYHVSTKTLWAAAARARQRLLRNGVELPAGVITEESLKAVVDAVLDRLLQGVRSHLHVPPHSMHLELRILQVGLRPLQLLGQLSLLREQQARRLGGQHGTTVQSCCQCCQPYEGCGGLPGR
jgi:hypothetical protein